MGERVWAMLTIPARCLAAAREIYSADYFIEGWQVSTDGKTAYADESEVNWGRFDCEDDLQAAGIPYNVDFDGYYNEWPAGTRYFRPDYETPEIERTRTEVECPSIPIADLEKALDNPNPMSMIDDMAGQLDRIYALVDAHKAQIPTPIEEC